MKRGLKTTLVWTFLLAIVFFFLLQNTRRPGPPERFLAQDQAVQLIEDGNVTAYRYNDDYTFVLLTRDGSAVGVAAFGNETVATALAEKLAEKSIPYLPIEEPGKSGEFLTWLLILMVAVIAFVFFLRRFGGAQMNQLAELRKSRARPVEEANRAKFGDIGGNRDAVEMLGDIVDFLQAPQRWVAAGTRLPRGVLLVGPPGIGKTLLARAVAGETQSAFFYTSASEFVEMFVGVGAARVRDTFEKAVAQQPCVIFIDEIDAIGRRRGSGIGTMHEEREQSLNQLLVLMDGMERHDRLVVMAATNREDILDPALLRSGRFDRVLRLKPPSVDERIDILKIHVRYKPLHESVDLAAIARETDGFTGADLETLANDAALLAVRRSRPASGGPPTNVLVNLEDFERTLANMKSASRRFDRLDALLIESISQFAEPTGRAVAQVTLTTGTVISGDVVWMNAVHMKLRTADGAEIIVAKEMAEQIVALDGTGQANGDVVPDRWAGRNLEVG